MAYEGGFTSALNSSVDRDYKQTGIDAERAQMARLAKAFQDDQAAQAEDKRLGMNVMKTFIKMQQPPPEGPQVPPPGVASVPMAPSQTNPPPPMPPFGANSPLGGASPMRMMAPPQGMPQGQPGGAPAPAMAPAGPPMAAAPQSAPGGPPAMPPPQKPWQASPTAPASLGGPGMAPPQGAQGGQPGMMAPPPSAGGGGTQSGMLPTELMSVPKAIEAMDKLGIPPEAQYKTLQKMMPMINSQNKEAMAELGFSLKASHAIQEALRNEISIYKAQLESGDRSARRQQSQPLVDAKVQKLKGQTGGGQPGNPAPLLTDDQKDIADRALRTQAWQYIEKGTLPYRKGTGGGKDKNEAVMKMVGTIGKELDMSPEEIVAQPADWKANAQSLAFQTKKLDAIEGQLNSFHNNLETWDRLAQGLAPTIGGERVKALSKDLQKINFTGIRAFDDIKLKIQSQFNDPTVSAYMVAAMAAAMDYARIMQGPQSIASLTEGARKDAERLVSAAADDKGRKGIMAALESDTQGQKKGMEDQLTKIRGRMGMKGGGAAGRSASSLSGGPKRIASDADYNALPSGTEFIAPDGSRRRKP